MAKKKSNILRLDEMSTAIEKLTNLLKGRVFDFKYCMANEGVP